MSKSALARALEHFEENQSAFARAIGADQQLVSYWVRNETPISPKYVLATEKATGIPRHELRPDLYPRDEQAAA